MSKKIQPKKGKTISRRKHFYDEGEIADIEEIPLKRSLRDNLKKKNILKIVLLNTLLLTKKRKRNKNLKKLNSLKFKKLKSQIRKIKLFKSLSRIIL